MYPRITIIGLFLCWSALSASAAHIFMTASGDPNVDSVIVNTLQAYGHTVFVGPQQENFNGSQTLAGYDAFLLLMGYTYTSIMPVAGQTELLNFVSEGGELVTGEWTLWVQAVNGNLSTLDPVLPATNNGTYAYGTPVTYSQVTPDARLNAGLPASFQFVADNNGGTESHIAPKTGATVYYSSSGSAGPNGVIGWAYGAGRVLSISTIIGPLEAGDAHYGRMLANALNWQSAVLRGDMNCDGVVNFADINPFVLALANPAGYAAQYPNCNILNGDINVDGAVNFADINPFVALLSH